jgi:hypothetical protein
MQKRARAKQCEEKKEKNLSSICKETYRNTIHEKLRHNKSAKEYK